MQMSSPLPQGVSISAQVTPEFSQILTPEALAFVAKLHRQFETRRQELLARRAERQKQFDAGVLPDFLPETKKIRNGVELTRLMTAPLPLIVKLLLMAGKPFGPYQKLSGLVSA